MDPIDRAVQVLFQWNSILTVQDDLLQCFKNQLVDDPDLIKCQDYFLEKSLKSEIFATFPVHPEVLRSFCKKLTIMLEDLGVEVHEDLYKASVVPATKNCDLNTKYFKSYFDAKGRYSCSLIETREFVSDGTTGLKTWPAANFLLNLLQGKWCLKDKSILELGSGVGFLGISLMKSTKLKKLIMTDHHQSVLNVLEENVRSNKIPQNVCEIKLLDWEKEHAASDIGPIDMVIGSDIVFDSRIIPGLVSTLKKALQIAEIGIIANVQRNQDTISEFQNCLSNHNLDFNVEVFDKEQMLLYQITNKT